MTAYIIRRLWQMIPTMLGVMLLVFLLFHTFAGDPAQVLAGKISNKADIENIRKQLGVDDTCLFPGVAPCAAWSAEQSR